MRVPHTLTVPLLVMSVRHDGADRVQEAAAAIPQFLSPYLSRILSLSLHPSIALADALAREGAGTTAGSSSSYQTHANQVRRRRARRAGVSDVGQPTAAGGPPEPDGAVRVSHRCVPQISKRAHAVRHLIAAKVTPRVLLPGMFDAYAALTAGTVAFAEVRRVLWTSVRVGTFWSQTSPGGWGAGCSERGGPYGQASLTSFFELLSGVVRRLTRPEIVLYHAQIYSFFQSALDLRATPMAANASTQVGGEPGSPEVRPRRLTAGVSTRRRRGVVPRRLRRAWPWWKTGWWRPSPSW